MSSTIERTPAERLVEWCVNTRRGVIIDGPSGMVNISSGGARLPFASVNEALTWADLVSSMPAAGRK